MADLSITEANVLAASTTTRMIAVEYGETVLKGELVYKKSADGLFWKADADTLASSIVAGLALVGGAANAIGIIATHGPVSLGAVMTAGTEYYLSLTSGKICPRADITTGDYLTRIGAASTTSVLLLGIANTRIVL